jgi:hypothetical protein
MTMGARTEDLRSCELDDSQRSDCLSVGFRAGRHSSFMESGQDPHYTLGGATIATKLT